MRAHRYLLFTVIILSVLLSGCYYYRQDVTGSGVLVERQLDYADFDSVEFLLGGSFSIVPSTEFSITLTADDNIIDLVTVYPADGGKTLRFDLDHNRTTYSQTSISIEIHMPVLTALNVAFDSLEGGQTLPQVTIESGFTGTEDVNLTIRRGSVNIAGLEATRITVDCRSSYSTILADVTCDKLDLSAGSGKATMSGSAGELALSAGSSSKVDLSELIVVNADVDLSYTATASLHATGSLSGTVAEEATLHYEDVDGLDISGLTFEQSEQSEID